MHIQEFDWDRKNRTHIWRHRITPSEVEEVFVNSPFYRRSRDSKYMALGVTDTGRYLSVVFRMKDNRCASVVTSRNMTKREKSLYKRKRKK